MTQTKLITKAVAAIGEEIGLELGTQMIQQFQESHPSDVQAYLIGRNIIDQTELGPPVVLSVMPTTGIWTWSSL